MISEQARQRKTKTVWHHLHVTSKNRETENVKLIKTKGKIGCHGLRWVGKMGRCW